jgi:hypothetical protein
LEKLKFFDGLRVAAYMLPFRAKLDKDRHRLYVLCFSIKMDSPQALACDDKIQRAWEDCEELDKQIVHVRLGIYYPFVNIVFFHDEKEKRPFFELRNVTVDGLYVERKDGATHLYFVLELMLRQNPGLVRFANSHFGTDVNCAFYSAQLENPEWKVVLPAEGDE